jgi:DNA-3-methyladenine glycosylase II
MKKVLSRAEVELIDRDPVLGGVVKEYGPLGALVADEYFYSLAESIVSQQLSVKASNTIFGRLREATSLDPVRVLSMSDEQCKQIGLSGQKQCYIHDLARHFVDNPAVFAHLDTLDDEAVIAELTGVVGIGRWTAQMFLIVRHHRTSRWLDEWGRLKGDAAANLVISTGMVS